MPRPSLPHGLKRLETMNVLLTKTTEEEIWAHMTQNFPLYERKMEEWIDAVDNEKSSFDESTFAKWNWLKGKPKLYFQKTPRPYLHEVVSQDYDDEHNHYRMLCYASDLHKCQRGLQWDKDGEFHEEFNRMMSTVDYLQLRLNCILDCLKEQEHYYFYESQREHERKKIEHQTHQEIILTCVFCVENARLKKAAEDAAALKKRQEEYEAHAEEQARLEEELWEKIEREKKDAAAKELERRRSTPVILHNCDLCKYHTTSLGYFTEHGESKEHKLKMYFCKLCGVQSRNENEFTFHCSTVKHRTKGGDGPVEEPEKFSCELCAYVCGSKLLWKQHCAGKKHLQKTDAGKDKESNE